LEALEGVDGGGIFLVESASKFVPDGAENTGHSGVLSLAPVLPSTLLKQWGYATMEQFERWIYEIEQKQRHLRATPWDFGGASQRERDEIFMLCQLCKAAGKPNSSWAVQKKAALLLELESKFKAKLDSEGSSRNVRDQIRQGDFWHRSYLNTLEQAGSQIQYEINDIKTLLELF
jgi:hypothetical protein